MDQSALGTATRTQIVVLADDLIWASRLKAAIDHAGAHPVMLRSPATLAETIHENGLDLAVIDLASRAYDGVDAVRAAAGAGATVLAVGQHDDIELRRRALAAGAKRVLSYNKLFNDGPAVIARLVEGTL
jgi:DNA-binding response OmpR family regulator